MVHGAPYRTVRALGVWAEHRESYLRGRVILAGARWDDLDAQEQVDVAFAVLAEPLTNGSWSSLDEILNALDEALIEVFPDEETFGVTASAEKATRAAEERYPDARTQAAAKRAEAPTLSDA